VVSLVLGFVVVVAVVVAVVVVVVVAVVVSNLVKWQLNRNGSCCRYLSAFFFRSSCFFLILNLNSFAFKVYLIALI